MASQETTLLPGGSEAKCIALLGLIAGTLALFVFHLKLLPALRIPIVYAAPVFLLVALILAYRLTLSGTAAAPPLPVILGMTFIVGGAAFDIIATLLHSPDLKREANPFARTLLDSSHSLGFVLVYGFASQILYVSIGCVLWLALLRHRCTIAASIRGSQSPLLFVKAATGGADLTWRQWMFPLRISELPRMYYVCWLLETLLLAGSVDRWYLGLEWCKLVPRIPWYVLVLAVGGGIASYLAWLWHASREREAAASDAAEEGPRESRFNELQRFPPCQSAVESCRWF